MIVDVVTPYGESQIISKNGTVTRHGKKKVVHFTTDWEGYNKVVINHKDWLVYNPEHKKAFELLAITDSFGEPIELDLESLSQDKYRDTYKFIIEMR